MQKRTFIKESDGKHIKLIDAKVGDELQVYEPTGESIGTWRVLEKPFVRNGTVTVNAKLIPKMY